MTVIETERQMEGKVSRERGRVGEGERAAAGLRKR